MTQSEKTKYKKHLTNRHLRELLMDELKKGTCKDFTAWDLNCPRYVKPDNKLRKKFVRKYRRNSKLALDKQAKTCYNQDTETERNENND